MSYVALSPYRAVRRHRLWYRSGHGPSSSSHAGERCRLLDATGQLFGDLLIRTHSCTAAARRPRAWKDRDGYSADLRIELLARAVRCGHPAPAPSVSRTAVAVIVDGHVHRDRVVQRGVLLPVAVLIAVMICRVMRSSANDLRPEVLLREVPDCFEQPDHSLLDDVIVLGRSGSDLASTSEVLLNKCWVADLEPRLACLTTCSSGTPRQ